VAERPARDQVPVAHTWNLADIYPSAEAWTADYESIESRAADLRAFAGRLSEGAAAVLACLNAREALLTTIERLGGYAGLSMSVDGASARAQAMDARFTALRARVDADESFLTTELVALPAGRIESYLAEEPRFARFRVVLEETIRQRDHLLHPAAEEALAALGATSTLPYSIWRMATAVDMTCEPIRDAGGELIPVSISSVFAWQSQSPDRHVRRAAAESLAAGLSQRKATLATALATHINRNVTLARLRRYGSATEMILAEQRVPQDIYNNVLGVVHDEMAPHVRRLMALRARLNGLDRLQRYDLEAPLDPEFAPETTFEAGAHMIREALRPLGPEYGAIIAAAFTDRWIDQADNVGKRSGAFCATVHGVHPYVFITWRDTLRSVFTLTHELGHAGHGSLAMRHQSISNLTAASPIFMVEAPSTMNELLLGRYLLRVTSETRMRRWIIVQLLRTFTHNMVTHLLEGHFERRLYEMAEARTPLTLDAIMEAQGTVFERFFGDTVAVDDGARLYWAQQPHFYVNLYPYTYAAGLSCACAVADAIENEGQPAIDRWLRMLTLGNTVPPVELLRLAGVDMTGTEPLKQAARYFGSLVDELEQNTASM
jgi:oligoendopeptidase F